MTEDVFYGVGDLPWFEELLDHVREDLGMTETGYAAEVARTLWSER